MLKAKTDPNQCCSETDVEKCTNAELLNPTRRKMYFLQLYITVGLAAVLVFYNVQPGTAAQLKN